MNSSSSAEYRELENRLHGRGFEVDSSKDAPVYRLAGHEVLLDVMRTDERILGFGNTWNESAITLSNSFALPSGMGIHLFNEKLRELEGYYNYHRLHGGCSAGPRMNDWSRRRELSCHRGLETLHS